MRTSKRNKPDLSELYISGTSSPCKSPVSKSISVDMGKSRRQASTPDSEQKTKTNNSRTVNRWYIRGHKFTAIHNLRKPRPLPEFHLAGVTHSRFNYPVANPNLLLRHKRNTAKTKTSQCCSMSVSITTAPKSACLHRRSSSKNLQVDPEELISWIN